MIVHYVRDHGYRRPDEFITAVMQAPLPNTEEFLRATEQLYEPSEVTVAHRDNCMRNGGEYVEESKRDDRSWPQIILAGSVVAASSTGW